MPLEESSPYHTATFLQFIFSIVGKLTESVSPRFLIHRGGYPDLCVCP